MNQSINTDSKNSKEPQQKYRLGTVSIKILGGLNLKTLNSSKGIIRDRGLKGESEDNIKEYLQEQGVTAVKRFKVKKVTNLLVPTRFAYLQFCSPWDFLPALSVAPGLNSHWEHH